MLDFLVRIGWETWSILREASVFLLFGFVLAGVLAVLVPKTLLSRLLAAGKVKSVLWASAIGVPLPLCSCGVVPTAIGLRRQGATPGATVSFLIATPETGVDSISLTYALMDPIITVFRPVAAVVTAVTAGLATNFFGVPRMPVPPTPPDGLPTTAAPRALHLEHVHEHDHVHEDVHDHGQTPDQQQPGADQPRGVAARVGVAAARIYHYAFRELLDETSHWLALGILLSGIVAAAVPATFFARYLGSELASMLVMLAIGIPMYTCASASTPVAAALIMKGLNPGAALVFLLAGPATNIGTIVVLLRFLGARIVTIYLGSLIVVTLLAGFALNALYRALAIDPRAAFGKATGFLPESLKVGAALLLLALLVLSIWRTRVPGEWLWLKERVVRAIGLSISLKQAALATLATLATLYVGSGFYTVQPGAVGIELRFGKIVGAEQPSGLHYRLPWPFEAHRIVHKASVQRMDFGFGIAPTQPARTLRGEELTVAGWNNPTPAAMQVPATWFEKEATTDDGFLLTGDGNLISLRSALHYRVKDALAYAFNVADPQALVRSATRSALRDVVATRGIDALYTSERRDVESNVALATQQILDAAQCGVEVLAFRLLYVHAPDAVHDAFRDVASAQEDKLRTINRARIFAVEGVNQAKGEAATMVEQALGFKEQQIRHAQGDALGFAVKLDEYRRAPELTMFRLQLEAIEEVLPGVQKFVRPGAGDVKEFDMWLLQPVGTDRGR